ncbi:MAG: carboxypeptidase regulatory-like domain-containing protein [Terriglobia bacterium]|nr:MAG: carboxypeptidase regulatory-like domain-containing protein [Terriglobia bacterium]
MRQRRTSGPHLRIAEGTMKRIWALLALALLFTATLAFAQKKNKGDENSNTRSVQGSVTSAEDAAVSGAVVQLKNVKTLQIRSFITKEDGNYYFHGLSPDVDYELKADYQGASSPNKMLSSFDSRKEAIINLKLNKK